MEGYAMFFYSDTQGGAFDPSLVARLDPTKQYCKHLDNWFYLKFVLMNTKRFDETVQATKELAICDRKLAYWKRSGGFDSAAAQKYKDQLKKTWNMDSIRLTA
jgi:hypothetical protein